jgi:2-dehydro-3-deoxyphosphooctonate aldolase (KDO 8-P synthase)
MARIVEVAGRKIGGRMFLIAGPCIAESEELCLEVARSVSDLCAKYEIDYIFKASYDKANRSSVESERGPGLEKGLEMLAAVREKAEVPVISDVHLPREVESAARVLDMLQVPAFLCRQTDLLEAAAESGKPVNVKKGQCMAPWDMANVVQKLAAKKAAGIMLTERGSCFGYNNLVVDPRSIPEMKKLGKYPVVIDATHATQLPGGEGKKSGGKRRWIEPIALAALAAGADGLFLEVHPNPEKAPCDADSMLKLDDLDELLGKALAVYDAVREP